MPHKRILKWSGRAVLGALAMLCVPVLAGYAYLQLNPIELTDKKAEILALTNMPDADWNLDFEHVRLTPLDFKPGMLIRDATITLRNSRTKIVIPRIELAYTFANIWRFTAKPTSVKFVGARIIVDKLPPVLKAAQGNELPELQPAESYVLPRPRPQLNANGGETVAAQPDISEAVLSEANEVLEQMRENDKNAQLNGETGIITLKNFVTHIQSLLTHPIWGALQVETLTAQNTQFQVLYNGAKPDIASRPFTIELSRYDNDHLQLEASGSVEDRTWRARLQADKIDPQNYSTTIAVEHLRLQDIMPTAAWGRLDVPLFLNAYMQLDTNGFVRGAKINGYMDRGVLVWGEDQQITSHIERVELNAATDETAQNLLIQPSRVDVEGVKSTYSGRMRLPHPQDNAAPLVIELRADNSTFIDPQDHVENTNTPDLVTIETISVRGALELANQNIAIDELAVESPQLQLKGAGSFDFTPTLDSDEIATRFALNALQPIDAKVVKAIWPKGMLPEAREWTLKNVLSGAIINTTVRGEFTRRDLEAIATHKPLPAEHFDFSADVQNLAYLIEGTPALVRAPLGQLRTKGSHFEYRQEAATLEHSGLPSIEVKNLSYVIADSHLRRPTGVIGAQMAGDVHSLLQFLKTSAFITGNEAEMALMGRAKGEFAGKFSLTMPVNVEVKPSDVNINVSGRVQNFAVTDIWQGVNLENAEADIQSDNQKFSMKGKGLVKGIEMPFELVREGAATNVQVTLTDAARQKILPTATLPFTGNVPVKLILGAHKDSKTFGIDMDLKDARVKLLPVGYDKKPGVPANFKCDAVKVDSDIALNDFTFSSSELNMQGSVLYGAGGKLKKLDMPNISWGQAVKDNFALTITPKDGRPHIQVRAKKLDARPFITKLMTGEADTGDEFKDAVLDMTATQALGFGEATLDNIVLQGEKRNGQITSFKLSASKNGAPVLVGQIQRDGVGPYMYVTSTNAGQLLKFINLSQSVRGGTLQFSEYIPKAGAQEVSGILFVENFVIEDNKTLSGLVSAVPPTGEEAAKISTSAPMGFDKLRLEFVRKADLITIQNSVMRGGVMGLTFEGQLDTKRQLLDFTGTFVPLYGLNNALTKIPLLGTLLGGGDKNEGILGVTYAVRGNLNAPVLQLNPMSAMAPGFLRRIFDFQPRPLGKQELKPAELQQ